MNSDNHLGWKQRPRLSFPQVAFPAFVYAQPRARQQIPVSSFRIAALGKLSTFSASLPQILVCAIPSRLARSSLPVAKLEACRQEPSDNPSSARLLRLVCKIASIDQSFRPAHAV